MADRTRQAGGVRRPGKAVALFGVSGGVVLLDQASKNFIRVLLQPGDAQAVVEGVLRVTYLLNPGSAFGLAVGGANGPTLLSLAATLLLALVFLFMPVELRFRLYAVALTFGGALGNLIDRLKDPPGVVDFIDLRLGSLSFPVFNLADVAVLFGTIALIVAIWWDERRLHERQRRAS
ncbi:MAG: signal peptidase II [Gemmatimonadota bacterium]|nr:signal peptidase II [Gemmatimonadota bacterium]